MLGFIKFEYMQINEHYIVDNYLKYDLRLYGKIILCTYSLVEFIVHTRVIIMSKKERNKNFRLSRYKIRILLAAGY